MRHDGNHTDKTTAACKCSFKKISIKCCSDKNSGVELDGYHVIATCWATGGQRVPGFARCYAPSVSCQLPSWTRDQGMIRSNESYTWLTHFLRSIRNSGLLFGFKSVGLWLRPRHKWFFGSPFRNVEKSGLDTVDWGGSTFTHDIPDVQVESLVPTHLTADVVNGQLRGSRRHVPDIRSNHQPKAGGIANQ